MEIADLLRMDDVVAACSYVATGDVIPLHTPVTTECSDDALASAPDPAEVATGSVLMFAEGKGNTEVGRYEESESFLFTFLPEALVLERLHRKNFVAAGASLAKQRVETLRRALDTNQVTIEVLIHRLINSLMRILRNDLFYVNANN